MTAARWPVAPAAVAAGILDDHERALADALLRDDAAFAAEVARLQRVGDGLGALDAPGWAPARPPALDLDAALAARPARTGRQPARPRWSMPTLRPSLVAVATLLVLVAGLGGGWLLRGGGEGAPTGQRVALAALGGAPAPLRADVELPGAAGGEVHLRVRGAAPTPAGHVDEVWFMTDDRHLVSVGTYRVGRDGRADVRFHTAADPKAYRYVDVSVEPDDGNPEHSSRSILRSGTLT